MENRVSFYPEVHKGIRSLLADMVSRSGRLDWNDAEALAAFRSVIEEGFGILTAHAEKEEKFVDPLLATHAPEVARVLSAAHHEQEADLARLRALLASIDPADASAPRTGHSFTVQLSSLAGELLVHMAEEEEVAMPALWAKLDDAALLATHQRLLASIPPEELARFLTWMLPSMNHAERVRMLTGLRAGAPAPVFASVRALAARVLSPEDDDALAEALREVA